VGPKTKKYGIGCLLSALFLCSLCVIGALPLCNPGFRPNLRFQLPAIQIAPEKLAVIPIPGFPLPITNSLVAALLASILLITFSFFATRKMELIPRGVQNFAEMAVDAVYGLVVSVAGEKRAPKFFPWVATIFIFVLVSNYLGLIPGLAAMGIKEIHHGETVIVPFLRSPSTDLNMTVGLALVSVLATQYYGIRALGTLRYTSKFFNFRGLFTLPALLAGEEKLETMDLIMELFRRAIIDPFVGLLELISEVAKIISFSFRLFGNIFAGEVVLLVIGFLLPYLGTPAFLGLELFVGLIQAFIFAVLTLAFMTMATLIHE